MTDTQPTMSDVAKHAGVAPITVSRVLNDYEFVKPGTRAKVLAAVAELGYHPNLAARALATRKSRVLGVLVADAFGHGPSAALWAIEGAAGDAGYTVTVISQRDDDYRSILDGLQRLKSQGVDGIVMVAPQRASERTVFADFEDVPIVTLSSFVAGGRAPIMLDSAAGSRAAVRHLAELGHRVIAHLSGPAGWAASEARESGWRDEMTVLGLGTAPVLRGDWTAESGYTVGRQLAALPGVTAIYAASDAMAQGALLAMHEDGIAVPQTMSVIGFDDVPESAFFIPPLTTLRQDFDLLGRRCIASIVALIEGHEAPVFTPLIPSLVVRGSTSSVLLAH